METPKPSPSSGACCQKQFVAMENDPDSNHNSFGKTGKTGNIQFLGGE
jgi:hypothetical protein